MTNQRRHRSWIGWIRSCAAGPALPCAIVLVSGAVVTSTAQAQTYTVLHRFTGATDGFAPHAGLVRDASGNLYGVTTLGGGARFACSNSAASYAGCGVVFKVDPTGKRTVLHNFTAGTDGSDPDGTLVLDNAGNLYGTTYYGGLSGCTGGSCGTVFKVDPNGKETVLYSFTAPHYPEDGENPYAGLILDNDGNLYGTTYNGGLSDVGTVFKIDSSGKETVLFSFNGVGGQYPYAPLIRDAAGNLYGTTTGGVGMFATPGNVFKLDPTGAETVLYSFSGGTDGGDPQGGLVRDPAGNLYGTTNQGGADGFGTVFKVNPSDNETVLYSFTDQGGDGAFPTAGLVRDEAGNLYGTTNYGGTSGHGIVFKLSPTGKETVLYSFTGGADGGSPLGPLIRDSDGNLYGTTSAGGNFKGVCAYQGGCGVVFKITP